MKILHKLSKREYVHSKQEIKNYFKNVDIFLIDVFINLHYNKLFKPNADDASGQKKKYYGHVFPTSVLLQ